MTEAVSRTLSGRPTADAIRSISPSACLRLRSLLSRVRNRSFHLRSRCIFWRWRAPSERPYASLSRQSMLVESPLSCIVLVVGAPTRLFSSFSRESNARHSGPRSTESASTTSPQSLQTVSPCSSSLMTWPPHSGQLSVSSVFSDSSSFVSVRERLPRVCSRSLIARLPPETETARERSYVTVGGTQLKTTGTYRPDLDKRTRSITCFAGLSIGGSAPVGAAFGPAGVRLLLPPRRPDRNG